MDLREVTSPTHKRTKGCAPVWGSEIQGDSAEIYPTPNLKLWDSVTGDWWRATGGTPSKQDQRRGYKIWATRSYT
jgi:hypothetical protein